LTEIRNTERFASFSNEQLSRFQYAGPEVGSGIHRTESRDAECRLDIGGGQ
jgi:hypothetical protein